MHPYKTKHETITINHVDYLIRSLKDRQQYYDHEQCAAALGISSATWPLFGIVWPSSQVLAATISVMAIGNRRVLEIGCGIALSSIVLHKMGIDITASDYHPLAGEFLNSNIRANQLPPIKYQSINLAADNPLLGEYDLIIGSDILYEPAQAGYVSNFIDCHASDKAKVIIVDPERGNRSKFTRNMISLGFSHHYERFNLTESENEKIKGRILHFNR